MKPIFIKRTKTPIPRKYLSGKLKSISRKLNDKYPVKRKNLVLVFVDHLEGKKLNQQFRGKNKPTDILSFDPIEPDSLGELVFCVPVVKKQALEHGLPFREELVYLMIHGILHLLGFEHEKDLVQAQEMYALQDQIFNSVL